MVRTAYWALSTSQVAAAAEITLDSLKEGLQFTGRKGIVAALSVATSLLGSSSHRPLSLMPATGLALVDKVLELAASLEFCTFDEEEDDDLDLTLRILPALQVYRVIACPCSQSFTFIFCSFFISFWYFRLQPRMITSSSG